MRHLLAFLMLITAAAGCSSNTAHTPQSDDVNTLAVSQQQTIRHVKQLKLTGQMQAALDELNAAIASDPNFAEAYAERGSIYGAALKSYDRGMEDINHAIQLQANLESAYTYRGTVYQLQNQDDAALNDFKHALSLNPNDVGCYANISMLELAHGNYEQALNTANSGIGVDATAPMLYFLKAQALQKLGRPQEELSVLHEYQKCEMDIPVYRDINEMVRKRVIELSGR